MTKAFIKNISQMKHCGVFASWPKGHVAFGRYNIVYGWNGAGKTTLSRVMRSLEKGAVDAALTKTGVTPTFQFQLLDDSFAGSANLSGWSDKIKVFNCDFVRENINADDAEALPIYHLGKEQGDALVKLADVRLKLESEKKDLGLKRSLRHAAETAKETSLTDTARNVSEAIGDRKFDKAKLRKLSDKFIEDGTDVSPFILDEPAIKAALNLATGSNDKANIDVLSFCPAKSPDLLHGGIKKVCDANVTKAAIAELDADTQLRQWVEQGVSLHTNKQICAFCTSTISADRLAALEQYFNDAYKTLMVSVDTELDNIKILITKVKALAVPDSSRLYQDIRVEFENDIEAFKLKATSFIAALEVMANSLMEKKGRLTEVVAVPALSEIQQCAAEFGASLDKMNQTIQVHNEKCDNFQSAVGAARANVINHYAASKQLAYSESLQTIASIDAEIVPLITLVETLQQEEANLDAKLREHDIALERINELLVSFIGRSDIKLVTNDKGYFIEREGERAKHLSEGEKTAIAFIYFISKLEEKQFDIENSVIVIDDPISSLDTNSLYAAASFIRCHVEKASQLFILTHNYHFFREIFGWMNRLEKPKSWSKEIPYKSEIMLKCEVGQDGKRNAFALKLDSTLRKYDSEYLFLFKQVYDAHGKVMFADNANPDVLAKLMVLPNIARRVLESFILFKFPDVANGSIINLFNVVKPLGVDIPLEKISILDRLLNRASHGGEDSLTSINMLALSETPKVIDYVLEFIKQADPLHFEGLTRAIGASGKSNDNAQSTVLVA